MSSRDAFAFIDESGVLGAGAQRFFGLGLLKLWDTVPLTEAVHLEYQRVRGSLQGAASAGFEFKFNTVKKMGLPFYLRLIDSYFAANRTHFCALVMDKQSPDFNWARYFPTVWDAYIGYSKVLVRRNTAEGERICVLSDYLGKPKASAKYYEREMLKLNSDSRMAGEVVNVCMLESHSALLIQLVDVLLGSVMYDLLRTEEPTKGTDPCKLAVAERVRSHLGWSTLAVNATKQAPRYFSVWEFTGRQ